MMAASERAGRAVGPAAIASLLALAIFAVIVVCGRANEAREQAALRTFAFAFRSGTGEAVDSRAGTVTKDMVSRPDTTIALRFTPAEMRTVYETFRRVHLLDVREPEPEIPFTNEGGVQPSFGWRLDVTMDGRQKHFAVNTSFVAHPMPEQWKSLVAAADTVLFIARRRPEVQSLPRPIGGYL
jgi:hypothetical protein